MIHKLAEVRDEALWGGLYFKCQWCGEIRPISEAVRMEFPPGDGGPCPEIWCRSCFAELLLG